MTNYNKRYAIILDILCNDGQNWRQVDIAVFVWFTAISLYHWEKEPAAKEKQKANVDTKLPFTLQKLNDRLKKEGGHFVNGKVTVTAHLLREISKQDTRKPFPQRICKFVNL